MGGRRCGSGSPCACPAEPARRGHGGGADVGTRHDPPGSAGGPADGSGHAPDLVGLAIPMTGTQAAASSEQAATAAGEYACARAWAALTAAHTRIAGQLSNA